MTAPVMSFSDLIISSKKFLGTEVSLFRIKKDATALSLKASFKPLLIPAAKPRFFSFLIILIFLYCGKFSFVPLSAKKILRFTFFLSALFRESRHSTVS